MSMCRECGKSDETYILVIYDRNGLSYEAFETPDEADESLIQHIKNKRVGIDHDLIPDPSSPDFDDWLEDEDIDLEYEIIEVC